MAVALLPLKEGETLESNFGRYAEVMGLQSTLKIRRLLFGQHHYPGARLPGSINYLAEQTHDYWDCGPLDIVNDHTEFRYLTMMAARSVRETILRRMLESQESNDRPVLITGLKGERCSRFRYCAMCVMECVEDQQTPYWKVDHQLAGVYWCVKHACVLKSVKREPSRCDSDKTLMSLIDDSDDSVLHSLSLSEKRAIEDVSRRSVNARKEGVLGKSAKQYGSILRGLNFIDSNSHLKYGKVFSAWVDYFGREYCYVTNTNTNKVSTWVENLSRGTWSTECPHPFVAIAGESFIEYLAGSPGTYLPRIYKGRILLKNHVIPKPVTKAFSCVGVLHRTSDTFHLAQASTGNWKLLCTCGLSYRLLKPKGGVEKQTPFSYGERYHKRFFALVNGGMSISAAARELNVDASCAYGWAKKAGFAASKTLSRGEVMKLRTRWSHLVRNTVSDKRMTAAREADLATYTKLHKFDGDWLRQFNRCHRSPARTNTVFGPNEPTSDDIREAHRELLLAEPPIKATRFAIVERAGFPRASDRRRPYWRVLAALAESQSAYRERVICWLASLASEQRLGDCNGTLRLAGLSRGAFSAEEKQRIRKLELMPSASHLA